MTSSMPGRTRIKFCGLVRASDVDAAVALGADAVGFVFWNGSPRHVDVPAAIALRRRLGSWVGAVGLFVNAGPEAIADASRRVGLDVVQLHGDETPADAGLLDTRWWKALRIGAAGVRAPGGAAAVPSPERGRVDADPQALRAALALWGGAEHCLLDSASVGYGGSGHRFDWSLVPRSAAARLVLSGGLTPENVAAAIAAVGPFAVDTSSGIQGATPREKDVGRMARFVAAVQEADRRRGPEAAGASSDIPTP